MADSKRQLTASKAATPKANSLGPSNLDTLSKAVGSRVRITTILSDHVIDGTVFTVCSVTGLVAILEADSRPAPPNPSSTAAPNFRLVALSSIAGVQPLSQSSEPEWAAASVPGFERPLPTLTRADRDSFKQREAAAINKAKAHEATRGKGVTQEAQEIFDHIARTLPTRWDDKKIIVSDYVTIEAPYSVDNCRANADKQKALNQIKTVVQGFWAKKKKTAPAVPNLHRKGG